MTKDKVVDINSFRVIQDQKKEDDEPLFKGITFDEEVDLEQLVFLTREGGVVFMPDPNKAEGLFLTAEQAEEIGLTLIRYADRTYYIDAIVGSGEYEED